MSDSRILWAIADQNGGEVEISVDALNRAKRFCPIVILEKYEDRMVVRRDNSKKVEVHAFRNDWPEDETRIDIIGQNGPTGDHYNDE